MAVGHDEHIESLEFRSSGSTAEWQLLRNNTGKVPSSTICGLLESIWWVTERNWGVGALFSYHPRNEYGLWSVPILERYGNGWLFCSQLNWIWTLPFQSREAGGQTVEKGLTETLWWFNRSSGESQGGREGCSNQLVEQGDHMQQLYALPPPPQKM